MIRQTVPDGYYPVVKQGFTVLCVLKLSGDSVGVRHEVSCLLSVDVPSSYGPVSATLAAPAQLRSQVISRSEHPRARPPGCTFFLKKVDDIFSRRLQNTEAANAAEIVSLSI